MKRVRVNIWTPLPPRNADRLRVRYNFRVANSRGNVTRPGMIQQLVQEVEPAALVVEPRILRRIIRLDGRVQGLRQLVTRRETYPILRKRLLTLVDPAELGVSAPSDLPERLILISPSDDVDGEEGQRCGWRNAALGSTTLLCLCASGIGQPLGPRPRE